MIAIDVIILVLLVVGGSIGFARGIVSQIGQIVAVVAGIICARMFGGEVAAWFGGADGPTTLESVCGYGLAFVGAYFLVWLVARMLRGAFHAVKLGIIDRLAGALFKIAQWALVLSLCLNVYLLVSGDDDRLHQPDKPWRQAMVDFAPAVLGYLSDITLNNSK